MTRSQFILGLTLLCVSGTLAFFISFRTQTNTHIGMTQNQSVQRSHRSQRSTPLPLSKRTTIQMDPTNYEVTVPDLALRELGNKVEADSRQRLQEMTNHYQLSSNQRRAIFPLLVRYHPEFQDGLIVNGSITNSPSESNLASEIYPILDLGQQEAYQEALLADNNWWADIIGQLREDLDGALSAGEVELVTEPLSTPPVNAP